MHAQAQITGQVSGQVTGQVGGQLSGLAQQNGNSLASQVSNHGSIRRSWHTDVDIHVVRRHIIEKILQVFQRHSITPEWQQRLPEFVKRLEEGLFKDATSKEEYMDSNSLEQRLQIMVKRFQPPSSRNQNRGHHNPPSVGTMIPTPGLQQNGNVSSMIPTPGNDISTANGPGSGNVVPNTMGNMLQNSNDSTSIMHANSLLANDGCTNKMVPTPGLNGNIYSHSGDNISSLPGQLNNTFHSQQGISNISTGMGNHMMPTMGVPRVGSQMIPTPGLSTPQSVPINCSSSGGLGHSNVDLLTAAQQQQQYSGGQNSRMYNNMNGQVGGTMGINMQSKNSSYSLLNGSMSNGMQLMNGNQHMINGTNSLSNTGSFVNASRFGHLQMPSQQHINQQRQHLLMQPLSHSITPLASDSYAMNAADLAGSGNMYNAATSGGLAAGTNLNPNSLGLHSKMIPVPGLSSQQPNLHVQPQVQQNKSQSLENSHQINFQSQRGPLFQQYQQQLQQPYQQNVQHQFQQYQQQHHQNEQNQNQQQQSLLKNEEVQSIQPIPKLPVQKHSGIGMEPQGETLQHFTPQATNENFQPQVTGPPAQPPQSRGLQMPQDPSNLRLLCSPLSQNQQQQQVLSPQTQEQQQSQLQNDSNSSPTLLQTEAVLQNFQEPQSQEKLHLADQITGSTEQGPSLADQQHLPQEVEQSINNHDESENNQLPQQLSIQSRAEAPSGAMGLAGQPNNIGMARQQQYIKQQRWLLFLRHASKCSAPEGQCQTAHCATAQKLWAHITKCNESNCSYSRCQASRTLLRHHQQCRDIKCPVCGPVRQIILQRAGHGQGQSSSQGRRVL